MVDPIAGKTISSIDGRLAPVAPASAIRAVRPVAGDQVAPGPLTAMARGAAHTPPVDSARVAQLRQAIADGSYTLSPDKVADRLIAMKNEWNGR